MSVEASRISGTEPTYAPGQCVDSGGVSNARPTRVLVIDDDPSMQHMIVNYLEQQNMRVIAVSQRQEVLRQFTASEPNVVILDLQLGQEDGLDLLRNIRSRSEAPVIIITGHRCDEVDRVVGLELGADDYVTKPFGPRELIARLQAVLRRVSSHDEEAVMRADGLEVNIAARVVRRDGHEIHLTPTEFDLLRVLVRNRGRLLTHRELLMAVWGPAYAEDTQVLRAHVANLRRKIEPADGPRFVKTDPRVGYRFAA